MAAQYDEIRAMARQAIDNRISTTGHQLSGQLADEAAELLACIWRCGEQLGVDRLDWRGVASQEAACIDVMIFKHTK